MVDFKYDRFVRVVSVPDNWSHPHCTNPIGLEGRVTLKPNHGFKNGKEDYYEKGMAYVRIAKPLLGYPSSWRPFAFPNRVFEEGDNDLRALLEKIWNEKSPEEQALDLENDVWMKESHDEREMYSSETIAIPSKNLIGHVQIYPAGTKVRVTKLQRKWSHATSTEPTVGLTGYISWRDSKFDQDVNPPFGKVAVRFRAQHLGYCDADLMRCFLDEDSVEVIS